MFWYITLYFPTVVFARSVTYLPQFRYHYDHINHGEWFYIAYRAYNLQIDSSVDKIEKGADLLIRTMNMAV